MSTNIRAFGNHMRAKARPSQITSLKLELNN